MGGARRPPFVRPPRAGPFGRRGLLRCVGRPDLPDTSSFMGHVLLTGGAGEWRAETVQSVVRLMPWRDARERAAARTSGRNGNWKRCNLSTDEMYASRISRKIQPPALLAVLKGQRLRPGPLPEACRGERGLGTVVSCPVRDASCAYSAGLGAQQARQSHSPQVPRPREARSSVWACGFDACVITETVPASASGPVSTRHDGSSPDDPIRLATSRSSCRVTTERVSGALIFWGCFASLLSSSQATIRNVGESS